MTNDERYTLERASEIKADLCVNLVDSRHIIIAFHKMSHGEVDRIMDYIADYQLGSFIREGEDASQIHHIESESYVILIDDILSCLRDVCKEFDVSLTFA